MNPVPLSTLVGELGGERRGVDVELDSVVIDSRQAAAGSLFVALPGRHTDGHAHVGGLAGLGAAAMVADFVDADVPQWRVTAPVGALRALARRCRDASAARVVGVTGSNGKTTVKEIAAALLSRAGETLATRGNYNNELGVPLTLCRLDRGHAFAVVEMGAGGPGQIAPLAELARPDVALVTNAGDAHLEGFGTLEALVRTKGEIYAALPRDGIAVINAASPHRAVWAAMAGARRQVSFAAGCAEAEVTAESAGMGRAVCRWPGGSAETSFHLLGEHNLWNLAAAVAAVYGAGVDPALGLPALASLHPVAGRLTLRQFPGGVSLLDDSYNANPASLDAALTVLSQCSGERWLALGDMAELGDRAAERHAEAGERARAAGVSRLFATGPLARAAVAAFGPGGEWHRQRIDLIHALLAAVEGEVTVLVKGSRSAAMDEVAGALAARAERSRARAGG